MISFLRRLFARPDPLESVDEWIGRLEDEARREQGITDAFARVYRDPVQAQLADMTPTQVNRCLGRESPIPPITRKRMLMLLVK